MNIVNYWISLSLCFILKFYQGHGSDEEDALIIDVFKNYNSLVRPAMNVTSPPIVVSFSLAMILLIGVDEKNQIMQTNVWLTMKWHDYQMKWDPNSYGDIKTIRMPPDKVWLPDIVLFNNADGNYEVSFYSNVVIEHNGTMLWVPPAIYKSSCKIDVEYFPFDEQNCAMIFGSWTYNMNEVRLDYLRNKDYVELNDYSYSGIWDIIEAPAYLTNEHSVIKFDIRIRRKTLFYTVILIIPTVLMAFLSMMVYFLPADASEKITLAISILLALVVFLLLVSKILPPTSSSIPLMAKYLLLTFVMNIVTILITVVIINVYFRNPYTHSMTPWVAFVFLEFLPRVLLMRRPNQNAKRRVDLSKQLDKFDRAERFNELNRTEDNEPRALLNTANCVDVYKNTNHLPNCVLNSPQNSTVNSVSYAVASNMCSETTSASHLTLDASFVDRFSVEGCQALLAVDYITRHMKRADEYRKVRDNWRYVATVIDRLLLYTFFGVTVGGTLGILLSAPNVFSFVNQAEIIEAIKARNPET